MKTFEDYGVALGAAPETHYTGDAVELAVATYNNLGLIADEGKASDAFAQEVEALRSVLPESVTTQPYDIVLVPKLGELSLGDLIGRYDEFSPHPETRVWDPLWGEYSADDFNQGQTKPVEAKAVLLGVGNDYDEPGLYFTDERLKQQRKSLQEAQKGHDSEEAAVDSLPVAGYIVRNVMQLERGEQLMDRPTYTRFIGLDDKRVGGVSCVPDSNSGADGLLRLGASDGVAYLHDGVRLSVGQKA